MTNRGPDTATNVQLADPAPAGITYLTVTLLCLERAATGRRDLAWSAAAGTAAACLVVTNLTLAALLPACGVFFLARTGLSKWRPITQTALAAVAGALAALTAFGAINWTVGGSWLFLSPSIRFARTLYGAPNPWKTAGYHWGDATWLALPVSVGALLSLAVPPRGDRSFARAMHLALLTAIAAWMISDLAGNSALFQYPYYVSYLAPFAIFSLALQGETRVRHLRAAVTLELAAFVTLAAVHVAFLWRGGIFLYHMSVWFHTARTSVIVTSIVLTAGALAVTSLRVVRRPALRWALFVPAIAVAFAAPHYQSSRPADGRAEFETTVSAHRFITKQVGAHTIRMWSPPADFESPPFKSIACTYLWKWSLMNETLPKLTPEEAAKLPSDTRMVLLLHREADADDARAALRQYGLDSTVVAHQVFGAGNRAVSVVIADLVPLKAGA